ncbi:MAG: RHS repeat protein [Lysobacteraceae bacterium]|nr:MAG: RHS repeat protein [Xanthomonadaceae bacterium]
MLIPNALKLAALTALVGFNAPAFAIQQIHESKCTTEPGPGPDSPPVYRCVTYGTAPQTWSIDTWDFFQRARNQSFSLGQSGLEDAATGGNPAPGTCEGNPIVYATGNKIEPELDFEATGEVPLYLKRTYNHYWNRKGLFGKYWVSNFDFKIEKSADGQKITAYRNDGSQIDFVYGTSPSTAWWQDKLQPTARIVSDGVGGYIYYAADNSVETYNAQGLVATQKNARGIGLTFNYSNGRLASVLHTSGKQVTFYWTGDQLTSVSDPAGNGYGYAYTGNAFGSGQHRLAATSLPGTPATAITYHYAPSGDTSRLLGKSFNGVRYSTFTYDSVSRAASSEHAGGVEKYTFSYTDGPNGQLSVLRTNPLGKQATSVFKNGKLQSETGHVSANCADGYREVTYDSNGFLDITTDFNGNLTDYDYNPKGQIVRKVEAAGTPLARETTYAWDANGRMIQERVTGWRQTDYVFRSDGLVQSVSQKNVSPHGVANQMLATGYGYAMHPNGMLATVVIDGPLSGAGDAVTLSYDASGNLLSVKNSVNHTTTYSLYNGLGLPGRIITANGAMTDYTYDARGKVLTEVQTVNGSAQTTTNIYDSRERLYRHTSPSGETITYVYDDANRLTSYYSTKYQSEDGDPNTILETTTEQTAITYNNLSQPLQAITGFRYQGKMYDEYLDKLVWYDWTADQYFSTRTEYDELGRVRARRGDHALNVRYTYDGNGNVRTVKDSQQIRGKAGCAVLLFSVAYLVVWNLHLQSYWHNATQVGCRRAPSGRWRLHCCRGAVERESGYLQKVSECPKFGKEYVTTEEGSCSFVTSIKPSTAISELLVSAHRRQERTQRRRFDRLGQHAIAAQTRAVLQGVAAVGGEQGAGHGAVPGTQRIQHVQSVEAVVQVVVDQQDFGAVGARQQGLVHGRGAGDIDAPAGEQRVHAGEDFRVVVHAQHAQAKQRGVVARRGRIGSRGGAQRGAGVWHADAEHAAATHLGTHLQRMVEHGGNALADRQPQAQPALAALAGLVVAMELLEDLLEVVDRDARAGVPHFQRNAIAAPPRRQQDAAGLCITQRVADEVLQCAAQQLAVAAHRHAGGRVHAQG